MERAGPCTQVRQLRIWREILAAKVLPEECGVSTPCRIPNPEHQSCEEVYQSGKGAHKTSGSENQWTFCLPRREGNMLETQVLS